MQSRKEGVGKRRVGKRRKSMFGVYVEEK